MEQTTQDNHFSWQWCAFDELTPPDLYAIMRLRQIVFIVEQACAYLDADGYDDKAWHLTLWQTRDGDEAKKLVAYARIFAPNVKYSESSIGRVITHPDARGGGFGRELMREAIRRTAQIAPATDIRIGAQMRLERFYNEFGFRRASEPYDEDGIVHIEMLLDAEQAKSIRDENI